MMDSGYGQAQCDCRWRGTAYRVDTFAGLRRAETQGKDAQRSSGSLRGCSRGPASALASEASSMGAEREWHGAKG